MPVSPARAVAFDILLRVEREDSYASELLHSKAYDSLSVADHALATELVMGVLRWRSRLDSEIAAASSQPLSKLDLEIIIALRLALYQFRWLDRIPPRAALHESVELTKRARKRSAAPFVNAVLRKLSATKPETVAADLAHPEWLVKRWTRAYGLETTQRICEHDQSIPTTTIRLRSAGAEAQLIQEGISLEPGALLASARRVIKGEITKTKAFRDGLVVIQDEASQLVAALIGQNLSDVEILDCCAAPGGKTLIISDRNPQASITAVELYPQRAHLLRKLVQKADPNARVRILAADARQLPSSSSFDRVLADVPCSGTGTLARNPEIKWRLQPDDLVDLQSRQSAILVSAMTQVAPGGSLVYSTCSLEREENEDVVEQALAQNQSFQLLDCGTELEQLRRSGELIWSQPASLKPGPNLRTIPGVQPCDGFFAAILQRRK